MFRYLIKHKFLLLLFVVLAILSLVFIYWWLTSYKQQQATSVSTSASFLTGIDACAKEVVTEQHDCYDKLIKSYLEGKEVRQVLVEIDQLRSQDQNLESSCHDVAHAIGRAALDRYGNVGDAFEKCDFTCHSGCYHGVMERMFNKDSSGHVTAKQISEKISTICDPDKFSNPLQSVIYQCLHGVGHAVLYSLNYKLEEALAMCDKFATSYQQSSCYGGVIMENITAFDKGKRDVNLKDPHYPCNKLAEKYKSACYTMQTSIMTEMGLTTEQIAQECFKAPELFQGRCFVSIGRDLSGYVRNNNPMPVQQACEEYSGKYVQECLQGVLYALVDNTWDARFALPFCKHISYKNKPLCYFEVGYYLKFYFQKPNDYVADQCRKYAEPSEVDLCIYNSVITER